jgi:RimJ/RimL family protein N-acetyltransferase
MDVDDVFAIVSLPRANRLYGGASNRTKWLESKKRYYEYSKGFPIAVTLKKDGRLIVEMRVAGLDWLDNSCVLGYILDPAYWNQGYATEALRKLTEFLVEEMEHLRSHLGAKPGFQTGL